MTDVDLLALARRVAGDARPGEQIEAYVLRSRDVDVKVFGGDVESLAVAEIEGVGVRVIIDSRQGYAWAGSLDPDVVTETVAEARDNAGFGSPDESYVLASPADYEGIAPPALDLWRDDVLAVPTEAKVALALELEAATKRADGRVRGVESASYGDAAIESAVANSLGVEVSTRRTVASCSAFAMAGEGTATQTGSGFSAGRAFADVDAQEAANDAAERAVRLLGAKQIPSTRLPVVLDPLVTRSVLALLGGALSGEAITKGRSLFVGREGEAVAGGGITLIDDPTLEVAFGAATHDAEGVPTRRLELIAGGRLDAFLHNVSTARRAGATTTGSAIRGGFKSPPGVGARALHLLPGELTAAEILASVPEALYVQSVSGLHSGTNPVSGDFSVGAVGLMVRGGEFAEPVREVTIASTLQRILHDIVHVGADLTWLPGGGAGMTLLVGDMSVSGA
ncbi:MAG: PmbA protein [Actinomycetota bacterium]|nr:PmbA protein [Actinomycetota bacterium]